VRLTRVITGENRSGVGDLLQVQKQFRVANSKLHRPTGSFSPQRHKGTEKSKRLLPQMNADQRGFSEDCGAPTCLQVFGVPKIASAPRHYWRKSVWEWRLAAVQKQLQALRRSASLRAGLRQSGRNLFSISPLTQRWRAGLTSGCASGARILKELKDYKKPAFLNA